MLHDPSCYAIYDSRVAVSLNYLVIRRVGHGRGYIGRKDGRKCFPLPPTKAQGTGAAHVACRTLSKRYDIPFYGSTSEFYKDYLRAIHEAAERLSDSERREICMHWVESMLFGMAQRLPVRGRPRSSIRWANSDCGTDAGRHRRRPSSRACGSNGPAKHRDLVEQYGEREAEGEQSDGTTP